MESINVSRVLVVEDEAEVRDLICDIVREAGLAVECADGDRAAYAALEGAQAYGALVVDVNLGSGTTGFDVARFARRRQRRLPVLFVTGQAGASDLSSYGVPDARLLAKPFTAEELKAELAALTDRGKDR